MHNHPGNLRRARLRGMSSRFLTLADVTEVLNISAAQAYALVDQVSFTGMQCRRDIGYRAIARELGNTQPG